MGTPDHNCITGNDNLHLSHSHKKHQQQNKTD